MDVLSFLAFDSDQQHSRAISFIVIPLLVSKRHSFSSPDNSLYLSLVKTPFLE